MRWSAQGYSDMYSGEPEIGKKRDFQFLTDLSRWRCKNKF